MTALGLLLGVGGSLLLTRFLSHFLFGVDVTDASSPVYGRRASTR